MCGAAGQSGLILGAVGQEKENVILLPIKCQELIIVLEMPYRKKSAQKVGMEHTKCALCLLIRL